MVDTTGPYADELAAMEAAYAVDDEGLSTDAYFEKHASDGYKRYVTEKIKEIDEAWERGEAI